MTVAERTALAVLKPALPLLLCVETGAPATLNWVPSFLVRVAFMVFQSFTAT
ncbi:hypothetical protein D3C72_604710 [compost metagenome]